MSNPININGMPSLPPIGYYNKTAKPPDTDNTNPNFYTFDTLNKNLTTSCTINNGANGIYNPNDNSIKNKVPENTASLDVPFYLAKTGVLMNTLPAIVDIASNNNKKGLVNQIQYLTCQLENLRNRVYDSETFALEGGNNSIKSIFQKFKNFHFFLIVIFIITIYLVISGFFGSMDLSSNVFNIIDQSSEFTYSYWLGLLFGLALPVIILCIVYKKIICKNLDDLEKYEIYNSENSGEDNPYGIKPTTNNDLKKLDILTLVLFILLIYAFVAVLFTIKKSFFGNIIYTLLIGTILFIISLFIYFMYAYIPFFNTSDPNEIMKNEPRPLRLFIDQQNDVSSISTNQYQDNSIRKSFFITAIVIFILALIFFAKKSSNSFFNGLFGSSAILIIPILWVFNFFLAVQYFYVYPVLLIIMRFIRYIVMSILYIRTEKNSSLKDTFSDELVDQLENFKNYSAPWGLIGIDELKLYLNMMGYENNFSKIILENNNSKNISDNKFVSTGVLGFLVNMIANGDKNINGIIYGIVLLVITIIISVIILYGIAKIQK